VTEAGANPAGTGAALAAGFDAGATGAGELGAAGGGPDGDTDDAAEFPAAEGNSRTPAGWRLEHAVVTNARETAIVTTARRIAALATIAFMIRGVTADLGLFGRGRRIASLH